MDNILVIGLIIISVLAVLGLGIKITINSKVGVKNNFKNMNVDGDVVGRDKVDK